MNKRVHGLACLSSSVAQLHNSLDDDGKKLLDDSLKLAEATARESCAEMVCGLCGAARLGRVGRAQKDEGRWLHRDKGDFFTCSAGPIYEAIQRSEA